MITTYPLECLLDRHFLGGHEAADGDGDGEVDVVRTDVLTQRHLRACFRHANHALEVADSDRI